MESTIVICTGDDRKRIEIRWPNSDDVLTITTTFDAVESLFCGMDSMCYQKSTAVSVSKLLGTLVSNSSGPLNICGSSIPLSILEFLCAEALKVSSLQVKVCNIIERLNLTDAYA